ncbi:MAG: universal stress protein [Deltaproteobacteria bacterium]|nr:universal stress protein [Deltaproteobacteria bacterium]
MRILVAVDQNPYSDHVVREAARLAGNTWADVTILGLGTPMKSKDETAHPLEPGLLRALSAYRESFLASFGDGGQSPYEETECRYETLELRAGVWEQLKVCRGKRKDLKVKIRTANQVRGILAESTEEAYDLIMLGCDAERRCRWESAGNLPQKVAVDASCSVLVVKERQQIRRLVCCLDHDRVSQESLEMINEMVTIHRAELHLVGLTEGDALRSEVEKKMDWVLRYYTARQIRPWIELVKLSALESFISQEARWGLVSLWMGKKSILEKVLPKSKVGRFIQASRSSVLLLR